jgi:AbrB family looped-hinge helix DNA binding protein
MNNLVKIKPKFQITIPYSVREHIPLGVGDLVEVEARHNFILIKPKVLKDRAAEEDIEAAIAEGLKDIEEGRVSGPFETHEELMRHLQKRVV